MRSILPGILSLVHHRQQLEDNPETYRPEQCLNCGKSGVWCHGHYDRKADREGSGSLNPITIPRFYCPHCKTTCSVLPECIPPKRHYLWQIQAWVFRLHCAGISYRKISKCHQPSRWTISRWCRRFKARFSVHAEALRVVFSDLGRFTEYISFWSAFLEHGSLSQAMLIVNNQGVIIP